MGLIRLQVKKRVVDVHGEGFPVEIHSIDMCIVHSRTSRLDHQESRPPKKNSDLFIHMRIARCEGFEVYKWQRLQSQIRVVGTRDC